MIKQMLKNQKKIKKKIQNLLSYHRYFKNQFRSRIPSKIFKNFTQYFQETAITYFAKHYHSKKIGQRCQSGRLFQVVATLYGSRQISTTQCIAQQTRYITEDFQCNNIPNFKNRNTFMVCQSKIKTRYSIRATSSS